MKRILTCLVLMVCFCCSAFAQAGADDEKTRKMLADAFNRGRQLATDLTVKNNVNAQAVLIPRVDARRIFGREIADNYAVIEVNVGNKSPDAALIIHGIFIDYSRWALSGSTPSITTEGVVRDRSEPFQASTLPNQVASEEYRVVRGQLLDAQNSTWRNRIYRWLTWAGNLAAAFTFSINEKGIVQGIASATGVGVPGFATAFPDTTVDQLNRVSDFGYQANKVIGKQGAEVIVCFFPIDRFLTPGFRKLFLKSPALFFAPLQMLVDKSMHKEVGKVIGSDLGIGADVDVLREALPCYLTVTRWQERPTGLRVCLDRFGLEEVTEDDVTRLEVKDDPTSRKKFEILMALDFIGQMSLNNVKVTIDGVMSVDITAIAAKIDGVEFDKTANCGDDKAPCFWADTSAGNGVRTGTIPGSYLTGGNVVIAEADVLGLKEVKTISEGSSDQLVNFSFKLSNPIPPETKLHFTITKPKPGSTGTNAKTLDSLAWEYVVSYALPGPRVTDVKQEGNKLTVTGTGFLNVPPTSPLVVTLHPPDGDGVEVTPTSATSTQLVLTVPADAQPAGCWTVSVAVGAIPAPQAVTGCFCFVVKPTPKLDSATRANNQIVVEGTDLVDTRICKGPKLSFQLIKDGGTPVAATGITLSADGKMATLDLPTAAKTGTWKVKVLLDGTAVTGTDPVPLQ